MEGEEYAIMNYAKKIAAPDNSVVGKAAIAIIRQSQALIVTVRKSFAKQNGKHVSDRRHQSIMNIICFEIGRQQRQTKSNASKKCINLRI